MVSEVNSMKLKMSCDYAHDIWNPHLLCHTFSPKVVTASAVGWYPDLKQGVASPSQLYTSGLYPRYRKSPNSYSSGPVGDSHPVPIGNADFRLQFFYSLYLC